MLSVHRVLIIFYYIVAIFGSVGILAISKALLETKVSTLFDFMWKRTLYILTFHFLAFKIVSLLYIRIEGLPIEYLSQFPTLKDPASWLWGLYVIVGISVPIALKMIVDRVAGFLRRKENCNQ